MQRISIVGAGIAGASTFFALARKGARVTLIDDGATGQATAASAGIIEPWSSSAQGVFYSLYEAGAGYYPEMLSQLAAVGVTRTDYRRTGSLVVSADVDPLDVVEERLATRRAAGAEAMGDVERISSSRARELFPPLAPGLRAVRISGGGRVDGRVLRDALIEAGRRLGGEVRLGSASIESANRVRVGDAVVESDAVVIAAGAWSADMFVEWGLPSTVEPQRGQITHVRLEGMDTSVWPTVLPISHHYIVAFDRGRLAVGATRESDSGFDPRVTVAGQLQVLRDALSIAPGLADASVVETRVGLRPVADGGVPIVGAVPWHPGLFVATGYGAGGLTMGPLLGNLLARSIAGEQVQMLDITSPLRRADQ